MTTMKISAATARAAVAGTVPADLDAYYKIADYVAQGAPDDLPMTAGRAGCFLALGKRLAAAGAVLDGEGEIDIGNYQGKVTPEEAFDCLDGTPMVYTMEQLKALSVDDRERALLAWLKREGMEIEFIYSGDHESRVVDAGVQS